VTKGRRRFRLNLGVARLENWAATAGEIDKNAVYEALFAVAEGTIFQTYKVLDDVHNAREFFIMVKPHLVVKICFHETDAFGILYIGPIDDAPDIEIGLGKSA
jgi:hypothetical protein